MAGPAKYYDSDFFADFLLQQQHSTEPWLDYPSHSQYFDQSHALQEFDIAPETIVPTLEAIPTPDLDALRRSLLEDSQVAATNLVDDTHKASLIDTTLNTIPQHVSNAQNTTAVQTSRQRTPVREKSTRKSKKSTQALSEEHERLLPLSVNGRHSTMPLRDMASHVNRGSVQRIKETAEGKNKDKKGYVPRPSNSFVLYRSAYTARIKDLCRSTNHQKVSKIAGASWHKETEAVKAYFEDLARIDNDNHKIAFPEYKFAPVKESKVAKNAAATAKRSLEESDDDYRPPNTRSKRARTTPARALPATPKRQTAGHSSYTGSQTRSSPMGPSSGNRSTPSGPYYSHSVPRMQYTPSPLAHQSNMYAYSQPQFYPPPPMVPPQPFDPLQHYSHVPADPFSMSLYHPQPLMTNSSSALFPDVSASVPRAVMSPTQQLGFIDPALVQDYSEEGTADDHEAGSHRGRS